MQFTRRDFLSVAGVGVAATGGWMFWNYRNPVEEPVGPDLQILSLLDGVDVKEGEMQRFLTDYSLRLGANWEEYLTDPRYHPAIAQQFLLSSDFFSTARPEGQQVVYQIFYDPYTAPCYNPLASLAMD